MGSETVRGYTTSDGCPLFIDTPVPLPVIALGSQVLGDRTFVPRSSKPWPSTARVRFGSVLAVSGDRPEINSPRPLQVKFPTNVENQGGRPDKNRYTPKTWAPIAVVEVVPPLNRVRVDS